MGSSSSKSTVHQEENVLVMTENDVNLVNQQLNNFVAKAVVKAASACSSNILQTSKITIRNIEAKGDVDLTTSSKQQAYLDFSCINTTQVRNDIANEMIGQMMSSIENNNSVDVLSKMNAVADAKAKQGAGAAILNPFSSTNSQSDVEQIKNYQQHTKNNTKIENIVKNAVEVGFTSENLSSCISQIQQSAEYQAENIKAGGNIKLIHSAEQGAQSFTNCVNETNVGNQVVSKLMNYFDIKTKSDTETKVKTESGGVAETSSYSAGLDDVIASIGTAIGNIFGGIFGGIFEALGLTALGPMAGPSSSSSSSSLCICLCCLLILFLFFGSGLFGSSSGAGQ